MSLAGGYDLRAAAVRVIEAADDYLQETSNRLMEIAYRQEPPEPSVLLAAAWFRQHAAQVNLTRWTNFREIPSPSRRRREEEEGNGPPDRPPRPLR
jgi:hypothetical protein